jgi:hypothetical protein
MTMNLTKIVVFKTNINTQTDKLRVKDALDENTFIEDWSVDLEDVDKVLRVVSEHLTVTEITELINQIGFVCHELD